MFINVIVNYGYIFIFMGLLSIALILIAIINLNNDKKRINEEIEMWLDLTYKDNYRTHKDEQYYLKYFSLVRIWVKTLSKTPSAEAIKAKLFELKQKEQGVTPLELVRAGLEQLEIKVK